MTAEKVAQTVCLYGSWKVAQESEIDSHLQKQIGIFQVDTWWGKRTHMQRHLGAKKTGHLLGKMWLNLRSMW
jgi:hypothetical protein